MWGTHKVFHTWSHSEEQKKPWKTMHFSKGDCFKKIFLRACFSSVQFSHSVVSNSLWPHELQHARLPCPSSIPVLAQTRVSWVSGTIQTISSSVFPFSSCLQSFPESGSFLMSQLFASGSQCIGALASALPVNIQVWGVWIHWRTAHIRQWWDQLPSWVVGITAPLYFSALGIFLLSLSPF